MEITQLIPLTTTITLSSKIFLPMGFFSSTAPKYYLNRVTSKYPFMTCVVRVNTQSQWQRTVARVLDKCHGVHSFRMDDYGVIEISGTVDPSLLLKMLGRAGRSVELCWFQFGECSSNLFMPTNPGEGSTYSRDGRYLHASSLSQPKLPSINNQNCVFDHDNCYYNKHDYNHGHGYHHQQGYEHQSGYSHGRNQTQNRGGEDIGCCRVM
ncbi:uncharacterized protein LOC130986225 [Salvia miltiorrhiza]|uniref:uncharacterized protein LOC130986225 n=1 Tax=Salvia miltiorrhiza TaxID=226208 RepID=UPI0025AC5C2E|nr:uncharacterized protein LOC130986225 [Salvia miltiorrhiza]